MHFISVVEGQGTAHSAAQKVVSSLFSYEWLAKLMGGIEKKDELFQSLEEGMLEYLLDPSGDFALKKVALEVEVDHAIDELRKFDIQRSSHHVTPQLIEIDKKTARSLSSQRLVVNAQQRVHKMNKALEKVTERLQQKPSLKP